MARPSKIDADRTTRLTQALSLGACYEHACKFAGISAHTLRNWLALGQRQAHGPYRNLYERIQEAEGRAVVGWLAKIEKAANEGTWQAAAWKLERRYPREYGRQRLELAALEAGDRGAVTADDGGPVLPAGSREPLAAWEDAPVLVEHPARDGRP